MRLPGVFGIITPWRIQTSMLVRLHAHGTGICLFETQQRCKYGLCKCANGHDVVYWGIEVGMSVSAIWFRAIG